MKSFEGRVAVVTGGGTGMGRELARQLSAAGCHVATCDLSEENLEATRSLCEEGAPEGVRVTTHLADVADEGALVALRDAVAQEHDTKHLNLLFNNAGIAGGGSFVEDSREEWERCFDVCWRGVYLGCRVFLPMLLAADEGHVVNTSSVNGFWASIGPGSAHTAYSAAKFAVKGFSEALVNDFRLHAPHLKVSLVMPGHVGTSIVANSGRILGRDPKEMSDQDLEETRDRLARSGWPVENLGPEEVRQAMLQLADAFLNQAPMTAAEAAGVILEGVREERWRVLVGEDAHVLDEMVRATPEEAYERSFMERFQSRTPWSLGS